MELVAPKIAGRKVLPWNPINIMPLGDIQYGGGKEKDPSDITRLKKHIQWGVENDCWFVGMGDYIDFARPSVRKRLREMGEDDLTEVLLDQTATSLENEVLKILEPTVGRWLTLVEGHHHFVHLDGSTTGQRFANALGCPYGGDSVMMRLTFRNTASKHIAISKLFIHHGEGGSSTMAGPLAKYERFAAHCNAQVFFIGHHHRNMIVPFDSLDITEKGEPRLYHTTRAVVLTGSFLRGYMQGNEMGDRPRGTYVERAMLPPVTLGGPMLTLVPRHLEHHDTVEIKGNF